LTSNIGSDLIKGGQSFGFGKREELMDYEKLKKQLMTETEKFFRPEFINRLDDVVVFRPLTKDDLYSIIDIELSKITSRLKDKGMTMALGQGAKDFLIEKGYNPDFGARPLRRALGSYIEDPLAESLLGGDYTNGDHIDISHKEGDDHLFFSVSHPEKTEEPEPEPSETNG
jgi:ATP-dependent Clp protease ATP-binding subunit ClpC